MTKNSNRIFKLVAMAVFIAVAYISSLILPIKVQFLTLDIKDAFLTIGALYFGPLAGIVMSFLVSLLELFFGSDTGVYGFIMNFLGSAAFSAVASLIYTYKKSLVNAVFALVCAVLSMVVVMIAANLVITPYFMASRGMTVQAIEGMIIPLLLPFNLFKGVLNASLVMLLYKPISLALKNTRLFGENEQKSKLNKNSIIVSFVAIVIMALALGFIFIKLGGVFDIQS